MHAILVIAEITTGKLLQKYLQHEFGEVELHHEGNLSLLPERPFGVVVLDASRCPANFPFFIETVTRKTGCRTVVLLRSMETNVGDNVQELSSNDLHVVSSVKPIKLAELVSLVQTALQNGQNGAI